MKRLLLALALVLGLYAPAPAAVPQTFVGDVAYTILPTDVNVVTQAALSTARTWTLPSAGATCVSGLVQCGQNLSIIDLAGAVTSTNTLTIAPASGETINGSTASLVIDAPRQRLVLIPTSGSNWAASLFGPGTIGSITSVAVANASAISLTTTTAANIASVALTAGEWDCSAALSRKLAASTSVTQLKTSISQTTGTSGSLDTGTLAQFSTAANVMGADTTMTIGPIAQVLTAASTTVFLVAQDTFTVSTNAGYGQLRCRRIR